MNTELQKTIDTLKANGHSVFKVKLGRTEYIYRSISRMEYTHLQKEITNMAKNFKEGQNQDEATSALREAGEELLVMKGLISPEIANRIDFNAFPAGHITSLSEYIMIASGFNADAEPEEL